MSGNTKRKPVQYSELLRSLLDQIPDSVYFKDTDNEFVAVSKSKADHLGVEPGEVVGKTDYDFYPDSQAKKMADDDEKVMEEEEPIINKEEEVTRPDGGERWVSVTKVPRYDDDGNVVGTLGISRDITGRKRAEEELAERKAQLESILRSSRDSIYMVDEECRYILVNDELLARLDRESEEVEGVKFHKFHPEDEAKDFEERVKKVFRTGEPLVHEHKWKEPEEWYLRTMSPVKDSETGEVQAVTVTSKDITERKEAEEKLTFERNLLESLLDNIPDSIYFKDEDNRFLRVSKSKAKHIGMDREEIVGKTDYDIYPEDQAEEMAEDDRRVMEEEESVVNKIEKVTRPDGTEHWVSVTKVPRYDDEENVIGSLGVSRDLTELWVLLKRREALSKKTLTG